MLQLQMLQLGPFYIKFIFLIRHSLFHLFFSLYSSQKEIFLWLLFHAGGNIVHDLPRAAGVAARCGRTGRQRVRRRQRLRAVQQLHRLRRQFQVDW